MQRVTFAWLCAFIMSCSLPPSAVENQADVAIYCILDPAFDQQTVRVYATTSELIQPVEPESLFVKNAKVLIRTGNQSVEFSYAIQSDTLDADDVVMKQVFVVGRKRLPVVAGAGYSLEVKTDTGVYTGVTRVPEKFAIIAPEPGAKYASGERVQLTWQHSRSAAGYLITLFYPPEEITVTPDSTILIHYQSAFRTRETKFTIPAQYIQEKGEYKIQIEAYDQNFHSFVFDGEDRSGLDHGYGLLGSKVSISSTFEIE